MFYQAPIFRLTKIYARYRDFTVVLDLTRRKPLNFRIFSHRSAKTMMNLKNIKKKGQILEKYERLQIFLLNFILISLLFSGNVKYFYPHIPRFGTFVQNIYACALL